MISLDLSGLSPEVARILLLRGSGIPPLNWCEEPHRGAKKLLDAIDDERLFGRTPPVDELMSAAVRALLYLWNGWTADAAMYGQAASLPEQLYLKALCERQEGRFAESKETFQQLESHPIFTLLVDYGLQTISSTLDASMRRMKEMLQMDHRWEPHLFSDAIMTASAGELYQGSEAVLRQIQCREFELLFTYCYEAATGQKLGQRRQISPEERERRNKERERRIREEKKLREQKAAQRQRNKESDRSSGKDKTAARSEPSAAPAVAPKVRIRCPKCGEVISVAAGSRGKAARCTKCQTGFLVPATANQSSGSLLPAGTIGIVCPKCNKRLDLPESARGKRVKCGTCQAVFMVPNARSPAKT